MARNDTPSYADLVHQVVFEAGEPLSADDILQRVHQLRPVTTKKPGQTIRGAISASKSIIPVGDGRYGWKAHLLDGAVVRLTLSIEDLKGTAVEIGNEARDALWPTFYEIHKRSDEGPVEVQLPDGSKTFWALCYLGSTRWGIEAPELFWSWLKSQKAQPRDHLLFTVLDAQNKRYAVHFEARSDRDDSQIMARNVAIIQETDSYVLSRMVSYDTAIWDLATHLLTQGHYHHPVAPDPLSEILTINDSVVLLQREPALDYPGTFSDSRAHLAAAFLHAGTASEAVLDPPDLPPEYKSGPNRRPRPSPRALKGVVKTYLLRIYHRAVEHVWRDIEIATDQTLEDLHLMIQRAFGWSDDHLYSFFMNGRAWDRSAEIGSPWSDCHLHTHQVKIGTLDLKPGRRFLYLFDYGDNHEFDISVVRIDLVTHRGDYPRIVAARGRAPQQYPDYDENTGELSWDPHAHWR
jgi:hypothetical protein